MPIDSTCPPGLSCTAVWSQRLQLLRSWLQQVWLPVAGLMLMTALVYGPVLHYEFLNWDDNWYIRWNDLITSWHPVNLYRIMTEPVARNFAPATIGTFLVEHTLWQLWAGGYHLTNVLIHLVNGVLVLQLLRQLTRNDWLAWVVAALFIIHPVQVESVAWISSRKTVLSATWMLASCLYWLRVDRTSRHEGWGIFWLVLALLSKAAAVSLPPLVVAFDVLVAKKKLSDSIARQIIPAFFCIMLILITMNAQVTVIGGVRGHLGMSKWRLLAIDCTLLWRYVGMLINPQDLCVLYDPPVEGIALLIAAAILGWIVVACLLWKVRRSHPLVTLAGLAWILLFLPVLNLFPLTTLMNDRYLYLPCVPFFAVGAGLVQAGWHWITARRPVWASAGNPLAAVSSAVLIGIMTWGTLGYLPVWRNPHSLWSYARQQSPTIPIVHIQWALTLRDLGRVEEARDILHGILDNGQPDQAEQDLIHTLLKKIDPPEQSG